MLKSICTVLINDGSCVFARWCHSVMKFLNKKLMAYNIAEVHQLPRNSVIEFQNICNEIVAPFLRHPVYPSAEKNALSSQVAAYEWWFDSWTSQVTWLWPRPFIGGDAFITHWRVLAGAYLTKKNRNVQFMIFPVFNVLLAVNMCFYIHLFFCIIDIQKISR